MNRCEALKPCIGGNLGQCNTAARVDINKKKLCLRHAQQEALAVLVKNGKAKEIIKVVIPKAIGEFVQIANKEDDL